MNLSRSRMWIPLFNNVILSNMVALLLASIAPSVAMSISILLRYTSFDNYTVISFISFSFASLYATACPFIACCSMPFSPFDSWICIRCTCVIFKPPCSFQLQPLISLLKNSTTNFLDLQMSWIMECTNCIFSWYWFTSSHSKDDNECDGDLISNGWIFNILTLSFLLNIKIFQCFSFCLFLHLCSNFYASFSLATLCNFSIALSTFTIQWTL